MALTHPFPHPYQKNVPLLLMARPCNPSGVRFRHPGAGARLVFHSTLLHVIPAGMTASIPPLQHQAMLPSPIGLGEELVGTFGLALLALSIAVDFGIARSSRSMLERRSAAYAVIARSFSCRRCTGPMGARFS